MRTNNINGTKIIRFRISEAIYNFLKEIAEDTGMSISEVCRNLVFYTLLYTYITPNPKSLDYLKKQFYKMIKTNK
ncbi:MAG: hypothetical protein QXL14_03100 [Candidatus Aenigmatarchaeota archaeon]